MVKRIRPTSRFCRCSWCCRPAPPWFCATVDMPRFGDAEAPVHGHVAPRNIEQSGQGDRRPQHRHYRGFDTLGEVAVIFTAGIGVMLGRRWKRRSGTTPPTGDGDTS